MLRKAVHVKICVCETKGVTSSGCAVVERYTVNQLKDSGGKIGSQGEMALGTREVKVFMGRNRKHSPAEVSESAKQVAEPVSVMEKVCSFLADVSSNGILDRDGHERKVTKIEREEKEVRRKSKKKLARLKPHMRQQSWSWKVSWDSE